jgi:curved DNA-binding protein CbpA
MSPKKTLYEILNVSQDATFAQIQTEYTNLCHKLESGSSGLMAQDAATQLKLVNMAFQVLRDNMSRAAYDAKLSQQTALAVTPAAVGAEALSVKVDSVSLKADAAALMAQAAMLNANALSMHYAATGQSAGLQGGGGGFFKTFRFGFTVLGAIVAVSMVVMVLSLGRCSGGRVSGLEDAKAQEKLMLQEYYQQYGVRPANKAEMDLLESQRRKDEAAKRSEESASRTAEMAADKKAREEQRFIDETQKLSQRVTENLQRDEERAKQLAREEDYKNQLEMEKIQREKDQKAEAERLRLRNERRKLGLPD